MRKPMRNLYLMSTVAAALLMSAGVASAQPTNAQAPERAPAAQRNAPAEKTSPPMHKGGALNKGSETKGSETTGQAPREMTPGQNSPNAKDGDNRLKGNRGENSKTEMNKDSKSEKNKSEMNRSERSGSSKMGETHNDKNSRANTTGQGAAGAAKLTTQQRTKISSIIKRQNVKRVEKTNLNISIRIGTRVPASVHYYPLPAEVVTVYPQWRGYDFILVGDQIVIIEPSTHEIVYVIES